MKSNAPLVERANESEPYVFAHRGYLSDHTRIFAIGEISDELMHAHAAMLDLQDLLKKETRPGVKAGEIYDLALKRTAELGYESNFMGSGSQSVQFVGHGIGLEIDEYPFLGKNQTLELKKGMTIALQPKVTRLSFFMSLNCIRTNSRFINTYYFSLHPKPFVQNL